MINSQDIKKGTCIRMDGKLYFCIDFLQGYVHNRVALTGFAVKEVDAEIELAVHTDAGALLDVL